MYRKLILCLGMVIFATVMARAQDVDKDKRNNFV